MEQELVRAPMSQQRSLALRNFAATEFRYRRLAATSFAGILLGVVLVSFFLPSSYEAETRLLVQNQRIDPAVSADASVQHSVNVNITEEQINSEVELLRSDDVVRKAVLANGLQHQKSHFWQWTKPTEDAAIASAVKGLRDGLKVERVNKTNLISARYSSKNAQLAASVLNALTDAYLQKKMELSRPAAQREFFDQQAELYKQQMVDAEAQFERDGGIAPQREHEDSLQKLGEFRASLAQARATIRGTKERIAVLHREEGSVPPRMTTQLRNADNAQLLQVLKGSLMNLQLKRSELLAKYQPDYRPIQELEKEITDLQAEISREENTPLRDKTTDVNPVHEWVRSELAKAAADLQQQRAQAASVQETIADLETRTKELNRQALQNDNLARALKLAEDNYVLYVRKAEEARIASGLDRTGILNVTVAESAIPPALPKMSRRELILIGLLFAVAVSAGLPFLAQRFTRFCRTPEDVAGVLEIPVVATIPQRATPYLLLGRGH